MSKSQHAKLLSTIKEAVQISSDEENVSFIVGSLLLYEQSFAAQNKEAFRKILNETLSVYGPGTKFEGDDRVIPLYILLGRYSRSSTHAEIFDRINETGAYRKSAKFYVEWSKIFNQAGHSSRAKEIVCEGIKRNARPESLLKSAITEMGLENTCGSRTPGRVLSTATATVSTGKKKSTARKQLFPKSKSVPHTIEPDFVLPDETPINDRLLQQELEEVNSLPMPSEGEEEEWSEDAENVRPSDLEEISYVKRKTMGILVPAAGFTLEDYDLAKIYEEEEKRNERVESNRSNIENNAAQSSFARRGLSPIRRGTSSSAGSSHPVARALFQNTAQPSHLAARALFQLAQQTAATEPILQPFRDERSVFKEEEFRPGTDALKNLNHEPDSEHDIDNRKLTGFEKMLLKRKSLANRSQTQPKTQKDPLDIMFSKMAMNSPSTSQQ